MIERIRIQFQGKRIVPVFYSKGIYLNGSEAPPLSLGKVIHPIFLPWPPLPSSPTGGSLHSERGSVCLSALLPEVSARSLPCLGKIIPLQSSQVLILNDHCSCGQPWLVLEPWDAVPFLHSTHSWNPLSTQAGLQWGLSCCTTN